MHSIQQRRPARRRVRSLTLANHEPGESAFDRGLEVSLARRRLRLSQATVRSVFEQVEACGGVDPLDDLDSPSAKLDERRFELVAGIGALAATRDSQRPAISEGPLWVEPGDSIAVARTAGIGVTSTLAPGSAKDQSPRAP